MSHTRVNQLGYIVTEACELYEQVLALELGSGLPGGGILVFAEGRKCRVLFPTREAAREAIRRTEHYRLAFSRFDLPEKANCRIELIGAVEVEVKP